MSLVLDTHVLIWWLEENSQLSTAARSAIETTSGNVLVSVATVWEIAIKVGLGKLPQAADLLTNFEQTLSDEGFVLLPITVPHVRAAGLMQSPHRDPFDRLLAAQAMAEGLTLITADAKVQGLAKRGKRRLGHLEGKMQVPARLMEPMSEEDLRDWYGDDA